MQYQNIAIATDLSSDSIILLERIKSVNISPKTKIFLTHIDTVPAVYFSEEDTIVSPHLESINMKLDAYKHLLADYSVENIICHGDFTEKLGQIIEDYNIDLLIIGHHHDFWSKLFSSARQAVKNLTVDMLIVPLNKS